ncbi:MAG: FHA domain-containing protein, partial [Deltaproteobacteria bacterium]|nr:FHA domain-containing protein [Deltaproteobacteria bacterium]
MAQLKLVGKTGTFDKEYELTETNSLGRHPSQSIQIFDRVVSKEHALVVLREGKYFLNDLGSRNGTFLNGQRISQSVPLRHNDEIKMGSTCLVFLDDQA